MEAIIAMLFFTTALLVIITVNKHLTHKSTNRYRIERDMLLLRQELKRVHQDLAILWDLHYTKRK